MSRRADAFAERCETAMQSVVDLVTGVSPDTLHRSCEAEGWTAAAVAAHIAMSQDFIIDRVRRIVEDEEFPLFDEAALHGGNARAAEANADLSTDQVIALVWDHGARVAEYLRGLSDDDLDRTKLIPVMGETPVAAWQVIERVLLGHTEAHLQSLRQSLATPESR